MTHNKLLGAINKDTGKYTPYKCLIPIMIQFNFIITI